MSRMISKLDLFAENFKIYFNQQEKIKTVFGGYLSILIIGITLIFGWFIGKDIFHKSNPLYYQQHIANKHYLNNTINKTTFPIAFLLSDYLNRPVSNISKYFSYRCVYRTSSFDDEGNLNETSSQAIDFEKCDYDHFPTLTHEEFDNAVLMNAQCLKINSTSLYGYWSEKSIGLLGVQVKLCDFDKPENNCSSLEETKNFITENGVTFSFYALEPQIVISNYSTPIQKYVISPYNSLMLEYKSLNLFIERNIISTDAGILFESFETEEYFQIRPSYVDNSNLSLEDKILLQFSFYSSNLQTITVRKYMKIPEIIASVGGLFKIFSMIGQFISMSFAEINKNLTTIRCLFTFEGKELKEDKPQGVTIFQAKKIHFKNAVKKEIMGQSYSHLELNNNKEIVTLNNEILSIINKIKSRKPAFIKLSPKDYCLLICQRKKNFSKNLILYDKGFERIKDYFDIIFIIYKLIEVDIMKEIFLTESQRKIFGIIKPILTDQEKQKVPYSKRNEIEAELNKLSQINNKTNIDDKLIEIITSFN